MSQSSTHSALANYLEDVPLQGVVDKDTDVVWVSSVSRWTDRKWVFDGKAVGAGTSTVTCIWDFEFHDGTTLFEPQHARLLHEARHFLRTLYTDRREGRRLKTSAAGNNFAGLRRLLKWMVEHNYASFDELNSRACARFCDWLVDLYASPAKVSVELLEVDRDESEAGGQTLFDQTHVESDDGERFDDEVDAEDIGGVTPGALAMLLSVWRYLWEQRHALSCLGISVMSEEPFAGKSIHKVSLELTSKLTARIPALPDAVAIPLMNAAHRFIATSSNDLVRAVEQLFKLRETYSLDDGASLSGHPEVIRFFRTFRFSTANEGDSPWHQPLGLRGITPAEELRHLVNQLIDSCVISTQAETGMRIGEISALLEGMNDLTGLPACITVRPSKTGMLDLYYLKSTLTKLRPAPVEEEWLLAAAPRGTLELPDPVRAIVVLQKLLAPIRALAAPEIGKYLIITMGVPRGFPTNVSGVTAPNNHLLRLRQKDFAMSFVDWDQVELTEETRPYIDSSGMCIRTHQWRKTYAKYVFQVDKRMLPAIARQFKHLSLAMTEGAYVGTSASLVAGVADFNRDLTSEFFLSRVRGKASKQEGRLAKLMDKYLPDLQKIVEGMGDTEARSAIDTWCRNRDMKIFFHGYGQCIPAVAPTKAECHKRAQTVHWANESPNYAYREPSVCTGCYLFLAGEETIEHYAKRYVENKVIWLQADSQGRGNEFRVAKARADQAKGYLASLGAEIPDVDLTRMEMTNEG